MKSPQKLLFKNIDKKKNIDIEADTKPCSAEMVQYEFN